MPIISRNPATEEIIKEYTELSDAELKAKMDKAQEAFLSWKETPISERKKYLLKLAEVLKAEKETYAKIITEEMGKPFAASVSEVEKCAKNCEYFAEKSEEFLKEEHIKTESKESYVRFDPLGIILLVMPWNFPFWQAVRQIAPTLMAGNTIVLKHASNVAGSALAIEDAIKKAGIPDGVFQTLLIGSGKVEQVISDFRVKGVSLTGSEGAGSQVAAAAGRNLKKSVMELGGNDAFIVLSDADIEKAAKSCTSRRLQNSGQVCSSPKRVIVMKDVADAYIKAQKEFYEATVVGDPMDSATQMGPLSSEQILKEVEEQVNKSIDMGAELITGGKRLFDKGYFYAPTILVLNQNSSLKELQAKDMPAFREEIFGPVSSVIIVETEEEAIEAANDTKYGLTASIWTKDEAKAKSMLPKINAGGVSINDLISSDPRLPFGGINNAGFGRELSRYGLLEFVNIKTIVVN